MYLWTMWCQHLCFFQFRASFKTVDRDSAVGITTCYGLDGPGIEFWGGGEIFRTCPDRSWGPPSLL